jgi:hypothetical protein
MASTGQKLKAVLFLGTVRDNRLGLRVAKFMQKQLEQRNYSVELFGKLLHTFKQNLHVEKCKIVYYSLVFF